MNFRRFHLLMMTIAVASLSSAVMLTAHEMSRDSALRQKDSDTVTYSGCLQPGPSTGVYTLINAKKKGDSTKSTSKLALRVVAASEKVKLGDRVLQGVQISGTLAETPEASANAASGEVLKTLTAVSVKWQSNYCG